MSTWGYHCRVCDTMERIDKDRFGEFIDMFKLAIDSHKALSPRCHPPVDQFEFLDWKQNPDAQPGSVFRKIRGTWQALTTNGAKK